MLSGHLYLSEHISERLIQRAVGKSPTTEQSPVASLTDRELEVFRLIGQGKATGEIAKTLHLSNKTIESHRENIKAKLNIPNALELSRQALLWLLENG